MKIPMLLNNFNVYNSDSNKISGVANELTLPELSQKGYEVDAAGMLGVFEDIAIGQFENMESDINLINISEEMFNSLENSTNGNFTFRGSIQAKDIDGTIKHIGIRIVERGAIKGLNLGTFKKGEGTNSSFKLVLTYFKIDYDGKNVLEIDKINSIYKVNGKDMLSEIIANC